MERRFRETASCIDCWTIALGAPSPIWQQGAVTMMRTVGLVLPSLMAEIIADPAPTARATASGLPSLDSIATTRLLVVIQVTLRSVRATPEAVNRLT